MQAGRRKQTGQQWRAAQRPAQRAAAPNQRSQIVQGMIIWTLGCQEPTRLLPLTHLPLLGGCIELQMIVPNLRCGHPTRTKRNKRVVSQFEDLQQCYLKLRHRPRDEDGEQQPESVPASEPSAADDERMPKRQRGDSHDAQAVAAAAAVAADSPAAWSAGEGLNEFVRMLSVFTHCSRLRVRHHELPARSICSHEHRGPVLPPALALAHTLC